MKKTHILETDLKTLNGESLLGSGDLILNTALSKNLPQYKLKLRKDVVEW